MGNSAELVEEARRSRALKEEEEEEIGPVDIGVGWMLLGGITLVTLMFHLVNWKDADIRLYSWSIISTTLSIFMALLIYQGVQDALFYIIETAFGVYVKEFTVERAVIDYIIFLMWFASLQGMIVYKAGIYAQTPSDWHRSAWMVVDTLSEDYGIVADSAVSANSGVLGIIDSGDGVPVFVQSKRPAVEAETQTARCWATLLAHISGFANINAASQVQQAAFAHSPWKSFAVTAVNLAFLLSLFVLTKFGREKFPEQSLQMKQEDVASAKETQPAMFGCGARSTSAREGMFACLGSRPEETNKVDVPVAPLEHSDRIEMAGEVAKDAEDDLACLATSFLMVQAVRFTLTGALPNPEGMETPAILEGYGNVEKLYGCAILFSLMATLSLYLPRSRGVFVLLTMFAMSFSWCVLWATVWLAQQLVGGRGIELDGMCQRILLALVMSILAFMAIWVLDFIDDRMHIDDGKMILDHKTMRRIQKTIHVVIAALGILVGFSWERCFDRALEGVTSTMSYPVSCKIILSAVVAIILIPAWRRHVLTKVIALKERRKRKQRAHAAANFAGPNEPLNEKPTEE